MRVLRYLLITTLTPIAALYAMCRVSEYRAAHRLYSELLQPHMSQSSLVDYSARMTGIDGGFFLYVRGVVRDPAHFFDSEMTKSEDKLALLNRMATYDGVPDGWSPITVQDLVRTERIRDMEVIYRQSPQSDLLYVIVAYF